MTKSEVISIRTDSDTKAGVENLYSEFGLSVSDAVNIFFRISLLRNGLPFEMRIPNSNAETLEAIEEVQKMKQNPSMYKGFRNIDDLFRELDLDDEV